MQKLFPRLVLLPLLLLASLMFAAPASAADGWLPNRFDAKDRVYLAPQLANHPQYPVNLDGLEQEFDRLSAQEGIEFYFVLTEKGTGTVPPQYNGMYARWQLDELVNRWSSQSGFNAPKTCIIMLVRSDRNANAFAWAVNCGTDARANGLNEQFFTDQYFQKVRTYLPNDIKGYAVRIAQDANGQWHATISHREFMAAMPMYLGIGAVALILIGIFLFLFFRYRKAVSALQAELEEWAPKMDSVTTLFQQLNDPAKGYLDFLSNQKGRRESFTGETKEKYEAALRDYSAFVVRRQLAADLYGAAKAAFDGRSFIVSTGKLSQALASLTTTKVVITGQEKNLRDITDVFGGTLETWEMEPDQLLADINALFKRVNAALGSIMDAFKKAGENKATIESTLRSVDAMEQSVVTAGLNFEPFRKRATSVREQAATLLADITANPVGKVKESNRINDEVVDLKGDIEHCLAIKGALPATLDTIKTVRERVATTRDTATGLAYPFIEGEKAGTEAAPNFLLAEEGNNPDGKLAEADKYAAACETALREGEWEQARDAEKNAETAVKAADKMVDDALAAKEYVEAHVPAARSAKDTLAGNLTGARDAADNLRQNFLAANYTGQTEKVDNGTTVANGTESIIAKVRAAYFAQNFVSARATLAALEESIAGADKALTEVHARLAELEQLRTHAREAAADAVSKSSALKTKRQRKDFTTSAATDNAHKALTPKVATLSANVGQDIADWPELAGEADSLVAQLISLDRDVDAQETAYRAAKTKVAAVRTSVESAETACSHQDVLQPAIDKLDSARRELRGLEATLETPKSDWVALGRLADSKKDVADGAKKLADQDVEDAKDARAEVASAGRLVSQADGTSVQSSKRGGWQNKTFTKSANVDVSNASAALARAQTHLRNRQWKKAKEEADKVPGLISRAKEAAEDAADSAVQSAIVIWIAANPEPRPEPSRSSSSSSYGGSDFGGSTGNSYGGGDFGGSTGNSVGGQDSNF